LPKGNQVFIKKVKKVGGLRDAGAHHTKIVTPLG